MPSDSIVVDVAGSGLRSRPPEELADEIATLAAHLDAGTHRLLACIRVFDASEEWHRQGALSCAHWLTWRIGLDPGAAREKVRVARALERLPKIDDALRRGVLSYAKVRAVTRVATPANEELLLEIALHTTGAQLERVCRRYRGAQTEADAEAAPPERSVRSRPLEGGMMRIDLVLPADEGALVLEAIERTAQRLRKEAAARRQEIAGSAAIFAAWSTSADGGGDGDGGGGGGSRGGDRDRVCAETREPSAPPPPPGAGPSLPAPTRADGVVHMARIILAAAGAKDGEHGTEPDGIGGAAAASARRAPSAGRYADHHQIMVHVDAEPELGAGGGAMGYGVRFGASLDDGTRVSAEALRRLTCDAALVPVTADTEAGKVLDVGRRTRTIPTALRRALWVRDGGCRFPGCGSRRFLHGHHVRHWMNGGATSLENLVLLCGFHHRLVHEEGFRADAEEIGGAIELSFRTPFGRLLEATAPQAPASDDPIEWFELDERDRHIEIDAATNLPLWDGHPVRYDEVVDALFSPS